MIKVIEKTLFTLYAVVMAVVSLLVVLMLFDVVSPGVVQQYTAHVLDKPVYMYTAAAASVLIFFLSIRYLFTSFEISSRGRVSFITNLSEGSLSISEYAFESIILAAMRRIPEARDTKTSLRGKDKEIVISISTQVQEGVNIPELTQNIQGEIKGAVEGSTGAKVVSVNVYVESTYAVIKNKVE